jgi:hypothetical protein
MNPLSSTPWYVGYADLNAPIDCRAADPYQAGSGGAQALNQRRASACGIMSATAGTAVVRPPWGAGAGTNDVTLTLAAGIPVYLDFDEIISGTATLVVVFWPRV